MNCRVCCCLKSTSFEINTFCPHKKAKHKDWVVCITERPQLWHESDLYGPGYQPAPIDCNNTTDGLSVEKLLSLSRTMARFFFDPFI